MNSIRIVFLLSLRTILYGIGLFITGAILYFTGFDNVLINASPWWPVYGIIANILCFLILRKFIQNEKIEFWSLINFKSVAIKKDIKYGIFFIILSIVIAVPSSILFGYALYGRFPNELMLSFKSIPTVLLIIIIAIFPVINSIIEEITYNGYIFPRLEEKTKNTFVTIIIVLFFFTLQHVFITFKPDLKYLTWRLLSFVPLLLFWIIIYTKMRRLTSLILVHWFMDTFAILSIIFGAD